MKARVEKRLRVSSAGSTNNVSVMLYAAAKRVIVSQLIYAKSGQPRSGKFTNDGQRIL
ncbi:MAG: hypothetical protein R3A47_05865 [Polyangiales bacterium]